MQQHKPVSSNDTIWVVTQNGSPYKKTHLERTARVFCSRFQWRDQRNVYLFRKNSATDDLSNIDWLTVENKPFTL
jgi:hypothetical protein